MGKLQDFSIVYDHESGVYKAGDTLKGQVYIRLADRMKMRSKCTRGGAHIFVIVCDVIRSDFHMHEATDTCTCVMTKSGFYRRHTAV